MILSLIIALFTTAGYIILAVVVVCAYLVSIIISDSKGGKVNTKERYHIIKLPNTILATTNDYYEAIRLKKQLGGIIKDTQK